MDPIQEELSQVAQQYAMYLRNVRGLSAKTVREYCKDLRTFFRFIKQDRGLVDPKTPFDEIAVDDADLEFIRSISTYEVYAFMNFVAGLVIILILFANAGGFYTAEVTGVREDFAYGGETGIQVGDVIYRIDGHRIYLFSDISTYLARGNGESFDLVMLRDGEKVTLEDFPMTVREYTQADGTPFTGFGFYLNGVEEATIWAKLRVSWYNAIDFVRLIWMSLGDLITGAAGMEDLSGPVGIVSTITQVGEQSASVREALENIAYFGALIAVNLAVMNLLPIPALDGGKIFFLVINALCMLVVKRQIPPKYENYIHAAGFALLMLLMLAVTFQDVFRLFQ